MFDKITKGTVDATISTKDFTVKKWKRFIRKRALKRVEKQMKYAQKKPEDYTKEEMKLSNETNKILDKGIKVTATAVRIPVMGGHSESVNIEFKKSFVISDVKSILSTTSGVTVQDNISELLYPMPFYSGGKDDVFVGRIRQDFSCTNSINLWIVADNLRKGAATNAIQIAEKVVKKFF